MSEPLSPNEDMQALLRYAGLDRSGGPSPGFTLFYERLTAMVRLVRQSNAGETEPATMFAPLEEVDDGQP